YTKLPSHRFELWTDGSSSLAERASGAAALLYDGTATHDKPLQIYHAAAGPLACSYRAECLALEGGLSHLLLPALQNIQDPTSILIATDSLSAI
ncbi:uncharacterized protein TM35_000861020, partial [Trypanosoma theileri]